MSNVDPFALVRSLACVFVRRAHWYAGRSLAGAAVLSIVVAGCAGVSVGVSTLGSSDATPVSPVPTHSIPSTTPSLSSSTTTPPAASTPSATQTPVAARSTSIAPSPVAKPAVVAKPAIVIRPAVVTVPSAATTPVLRLVPEFIAFTQRRKNEMAAYSLRHYGASSWRLSPSMIVLHFTESDTASSARNTFANDSRNLGELPGTCAHFIVAKNGDVWQIVPTSIRCRHTIGLNDKAIGIEIVQRSYGNGAHWADQQILNRPAQIGAVLALIRSLQRQYGISTSNIIGHAMANQAPQFRDIEGWRNNHTDWQTQDVLEVRRRLSATR